MATNQLVGVVLIAAAMLDVVVTFIVVGPRIPDPSRRRTVQLAVLAGAGVMLGFGAAFLAGALGTG
jgi:hypothetical protein